MGSSFNDLPHDLVHLFLLETARISIDALKSFICTSRAVYTVYRSNELTIVRTALAHATKLGEDSVYNLAIQLAKKSMGLDRKEEMDMTDGEGGDVVRVDSESDESLPVIKEALSVHYRLHLLSRFLRAVDALKNDERLLYPQNTPYSPESWLRTTYDYALNGCAEDPDRHRPDRELHKILYLLLSSLKREAMSLWPFRRVDKKHQIIVATNMVTEGVGADAWEWVGELLGVWSNKSKIERWEKRLREVAKQRDRFGKRKVLLEGKGDFERWWKKHKKSTETQELLDAWMEEHGAFKEVKLKC